MASATTTLTLIGGPTVLLKVAGYRVLTDPAFDAPQSYDAGGITLHKTTGPALSADEVGSVDAVLLSHDQHLDNLDRAGRAFLARASTTFTTRAGATRLSSTSVTGLAPWESAQIARPGHSALHITATPARHGPAGFEPISGDVIGFLLGIDRPGDAIYVSGDTVWYDGVAEIARRYTPRLVILFTGAARPRGPFRVTMDTNEAIEAAHAFPAAEIVCVHNDGWAHFTESEDDVARAFSAVGIARRLRRLRAGEPTPIALD